jgi:Mycotoxin biosynthesis protein UstYa
MEYRANANQTWQTGHVTHCLHVLREDIICNADDLPRYTGRINAEAGNHIVSSGTGQIRMCRDWSQLREFALHNSACYRRPSDHIIPLLDRYKFCPDGSKPWEKMDEV